MLPLRPRPSLRARPRAIAYSLGLFSNLGNATALIQRLKAADIPVRSETRVSVGPFQTRAEAEEAMQKLKDMGLSPMLAANGG